ncbi:3-phosphoglycerate dehydrogenase family protein [Rubrivirga sp. S365]|uniref:D-3-phosphoglycerate dehydrogenase n=1 Tax=Rubrivirga litoralis TaxID=3075598 RepID=A0ABU3BUN4_9BACT|nr:MULTISPECIES: 3-phosphoglycerate dehydrogenase family protein [unclassified Rubrivirga]MDT0632993.1 3-phosphoglycerate dehydrogenase family protein [Rubrivirga sp. F394]MDT7857879.1 3-phosphoglycerate dehydrogenase family protein [Rubrivirga sp. S365]
MTVLVADSVSDAALDAIREGGHDVVEDPGLKGDALVDALREHDPAVLVVRSTKVPAEALDAAPSLELVVRAGAGVDTIDVAGASTRGVFVANCPGKNAAAVAELAFGLLLALDRRIPDNVIAARAGRWDKKGFASARGVRGRTLGLLGMGSIGREMAERARAFGMPVVAWSRSLTDDDARALGVTRADTPLDVARQADMVSVHVASTPETRHLVDADFLEAMPEGAALVNTARADVVDEAAVARAVDTRGLRYATDVPAGEPAAKQGDFEHPLADAAYITHHVGASTDQATEAIGQEAARVVLAYAETGRVPNSVNLADQTAATHLLTVRHLDRVGVLAGVLAVVREAGWNVQEMENLVFTGGGAAVARVRFDGAPSDEALARIREVEHVLNATVIAV